jgi:hypothetical protein
LQRAYLVHFVGLQKPWHPGSWRVIAVFLSIVFESSLALRSDWGKERDYAGDFAGLGADTVSRGSAANRPLFSLGPYFFAD